MKTNDYVKYITQTVVKYMDQPKDERKKNRIEKRESKPDFIYRWFGLVPYYIMGKMKQRKE